jgi:thiosulfate reductase / polysulfide reductase chain A
VSSLMAPNVGGVDVPDRRTVYSMCEMCAVRCPTEVTVGDGRGTWLQGNPHDKAIGTSLCAKGAAGLSLDFDGQRPQTPLIRTGPRGGGQWRRASRDEALGYVAEGLKETVEAFGARGIALSDRGGPFVDLTRTFVQALGSPKTPAHRGFVRDRLPDHMTAHLDRELCPSYARRGSTAGVSTRLRLLCSQQGHREES